MLLNTLIATDPDVDEVTQQAALECAKKSQAELNSDDSQAERLVRWMSAMARLRAARLILRAG